MIFYEIPESTSEKNIDRFKHDCGLLKEIFERKGISIQSKWLIKVFRLGSKIEEKPRPLLVQFDTVETRKLMKSHCHELKLLKDSVSTKIHHSLDLTPLQRSERKKLYEELKLRQSKGEKNIGIVQGEIVENYFPDTAQRFDWASIIEDIFTESK